MLKRKQAILLASLLGFGLLSLSLNYCYSHPLLPQAASPPQPEYDRFLRLLSFPYKQETPCPVQTAHTYVLLLIGQSNAGNHAEQKYQTIFGEKVINLVGNRCFLAASPLLGTTGLAGESWTLLGNQLVDSGKADQVILIPAAVSGTEIARWQEGGNLNQMLRSVITQAQARYRITHVLWHQGEADISKKTTSLAYHRRFLSLVNSLRQQGLIAPIYVSVASICGSDPHWNPNNPVAVAQKSLPDPVRQIFPGVNTDDLLQAQDRLDGCHFSRSGQEKFAKAWLSLLPAP